MSVVRRTILPAGFLALTAGLVGCGAKKAAPPAPPPAKVTVARPVPKDVTTYREYTGYLEAVETVSVRARVRGFVEKVAFKEGTEVKEGDPLYEIDDREYKAKLASAKADLAEKQAQAHRARADEERAKSLRRSNALSEEEYQSRVAARDVAEADVEGAKAAIEVAELDLEFTKITAEINGRVSRTQVTPGNLVGYNEPTLLTTINRTDELYVYFDVPERNVIEYNKLIREKNYPEAWEGKVPLAIAVTGEEGFPHKGHIDFRENRVETGSGTVRIRGLVPNPDRVLVSGMFARIQVPFGGPQPRLLIPEVALMADQRGRFVWVVKPDGTAEYRPVVVGTKVGEMAAIEKGLNPEDRVVVNGLQKVRPGAKLDPQEAANSGRPDGSPTAPEKK